MEVAKGSIAIMGSGETSPNLVSVHRDFVKQVDNQVNAYLIDTPFGFQENADVLVDKLKLFFKKSVRIDIKLASLRTQDSIDSVDYFEMLEELKNSNFIFSGPGSPSYASKTWINSEIPLIISNHLRNGKYAVFSSQEIENELFNDDYTDNKRIRGIISRLNKKLNSNIVISVYGQGYELNLEESC